MSWQSIARPRRPPQRVPKVSPAPQPSWRSGLRSLPSRLGSSIAGCTAESRNDCRGLDLEPRLGLEQTSDLHQRHCREVVAQHSTIGLAELAPSGKVFIYVEH